MPNPPKKRLPFEPIVSSLEEVEVALREIAFCEAAEQAENARLDAEFNSLREQSAANRIIKFGRESTTNTERAARLRAVVTAYAEAHPDEFQIDGKKSRKLMHGVVQFKSSGERVTYSQGESAASVSKRFASIGTWMTAIAKFLNAFSLRVLPRGRVLHTGLFGLTVKPVISLDRVSASYAAGNVSEKELEALGFAVAPASETVTVKPEVYRPDGE